MKRTAIDLSARYGPVGQGILHDYFKASHSRHLLQVNVLANIDAAMPFRAETIRGYIQGRLYPYLTDLSQQVLVLLTISTVFSRLRFCAAEHQ